MFEDKNIFEGKKGITLISLIVLIIVLIILAGVSIMMLAGNNGLLDRTTKAKQKTEEAGVIENIRLAYQNALIGQYTNDGKTIAEQIKEDLEAIYGVGTVTATESEGVYTVVTPDGTYLIDGNGNISRKSGIIIKQNGAKIESITLQIIDGDPKEETIIAEIEGLEGKEISWELDGSESDKAKITLTVAEDKKSATLKGTGATTGEVKLVAKCGEESAECKLTVVSVVHVSSISNITPTEATVDRGSEQTIIATVNEGATERLSFEVTSGNAEHIKISELEVDEANNTQTVTIEVLSGATSGEEIIITAQNGDGNLTENNTVTITVNVPVESVSIAPETEIKIETEGTVELTAEVLPVDATESNVTWTISPTDESIAKLSGTSGSTVTVTGVAEGTATVTASSGGKTATKSIKVTTPVLSYYGTQVATGVTSVNGQTISDNWKIFYADSNNVYLIYGDYYPANVQTEITSGTNSTIFIPAHTYNSTTKAYKDSNYTYSVNSLTDKNTLLRYLKNNTGYDYTSYTTNKNYDSVGVGSTSATQYDSWKNLLTAFGNGNDLAKKATSVQGSPTFEMWVDSWNEKYNKKDGKVAKLRTFVKGSNTDGYLIGDSDTTPTTYISNKVGDSAKKTGYYDTLYYPYTGSQTTANGYWLASPGGSSAGTLCHVSSSGYVFCDSSFGYHERAARPVISIPKSDFNSNNTEGITID